MVKAALLLPRKCILTQPPPHPPSLDTAGHKGLVNIFSPLAPVWSSKHEQCLNICMMIDAPLYLLDLFFFYTFTAF